MKAKTLLLSLLLFIIPSIAAASFTVIWDHNSPLPDGYSLYAREDGASYEYDQPIWEGIESTVTVTDLLPPLPAINPVENFVGSYDKSTGEITLNWTQPPPIVNDQLYYLVVRAFIGTRGAADFMDSADSEEVNITQSNGNIANKWDIFYSLTPGGPYTKIDETTSSGGVTAPFTAVPEGQKEDVYFVVVTFGDEGTFSENSAEVQLTIDRRTPPQPPQNVNVEVVIPVQ